LKEKDKIMLHSLHVKNLALIDEVEVDFKPGLNILTGETGAGKSILLGSVDLALGGRYNSDILRAGAPYGLVELTFYIDNENLNQELSKVDVTCEEGFIVLSRRLMDGRSISKINGETVNINQLQKVADLLINVHGQHEHQTLRSKKNHLTFVDDYGGEKVANLKAEVQRLYRDYRLKKKSLEEADLDEASRKKEISFLEFEINEIEAAALKSLEDEELEEEYRRMVNGKKLTENTEQAYYYTSSGSEANVSDLLSRAISSLAQVERFDEKGAQLYQQLVEIDSLLNDFNHELSDYEKSLEFSKEDFLNTENRLNLINHLKAKYGKSIADIEAYLSACQVKLEKLQNYEGYISGLKKEYEAAKDKIEIASTKLSDYRKEIAKEFSKAICYSLKDLNILDVKFEIEFNNTESYTSEGVDQVEFYISTNLGEPIKPLGSVASGGELSRIMLAIKTLLADKEEVGTMIFDEIDAGISGVTARKVASKLQIIGNKCQVICITHLPQIAAMADVHYLIVKCTSENKTETKIIHLNEDESIKELARILGGDNITDSVLATAKEMKNIKKDSD